jgi:hypothetical protein
MDKNYLTPYRFQSTVMTNSILVPYRDRGRRKPVEFLVIAAAFGLLDSLAAGLGTDSRDGDDWIQHRSV